MIIHFGYFPRIVMCTVYGQYGHGDVLLFIERERERKNIFIEY